MLKENIIQCKCCGKNRTQYGNGIPYCQVCYRKLLDEYSLYDYAVDKTQIKGTALKICELLIEEGIPRTEIYKKLNLNKNYVQQIIKKYTFRCNEKGEKRPF